MEGVQEYGYKYEFSWKYNQTFIYKNYVFQKVWLKLSYHLEY